MERVAYPMARGRIVWRIALMLVIAALMVLFALYMPTDGRRGWLVQPVGWGTAVICVGYAIALLMKLGEREGLIVDAQGFSYRPYLIRRHFPWTRVSDFVVYTRSGVSWVSFTDRLSGSGFVENINRDQTGHSNVIMPIHYDWPIDQVCGALNHYREQALARAR